MNNKIDLRFGILAGMVFLAALSRLLPHPVNVTPLGAMALFGGAYFSRKYLAFFIPFIAMWLSDLYLDNVIYAKMYPEFYNGFSVMGNLWVYGSFALIVGLGWLLLKKVKPGNLILTSVLASTLFFLLTNFGVWISSPVYPNTGAGLLACYAAGLPYFWNTLFGDLFYVGILFGAFEWAKTRIPALQFERI